MKRLMLLLALAAAASAVSSCTAHKGDFSLVNNAREPIARASVSVCGQTIELENVQSGGRVEGSYRVTSESHYTVRVEFPSGRSLTRDIGYVTSGLDFRDEIVVSDSDIQITKPALDRQR